MCGGISLPLPVLYHLKHVEKRKANFQGGMEVIGEGKASGISSQGLAHTYFS